MYPIPRDDVALASPSGRCSYCSTTSRSLGASVSHPMSSLFSVRSSPLQPPSAVRISPPPTSRPQTARYLCPVNASPRTVRWYSWTGVRITGRAAWDAATTTCADSGVEPICWRDTTHCPLNFSPKALLVLDRGVSMHCRLTVAHRGSLPPNSGRRRQDVLSRQRRSCSGISSTAVGCFLLN
jgi:hypothetical protein